MNAKIGFIGAGNMGSAIIGGVLKSSLVKADDIFVSDVNEKALAELRKKTGVNVSTDNQVTVKNADILFLSVKPHIYPAVISEIRDAVDDSILVVSIAAGQTKANIEEMFGKKIRLVRTMPNTPALVGEGMSLICPGDMATEQDVSSVTEIFSSFGKAFVVDEKLIDTAGVLSGCGPAFTYMYIEALADAVVEYGVQRDMAYQIASQMVLGSAKMVLETGIHPGRLKDNVCSPGGTTIKGVVALEHTGFRSSVISAVEESIEKSFEMSKK